MRDRAATTRVAKFEMAIRSLALALACSSLLAALPVRAGAPVPLDYSAYNGWNAIRTPKLSDDGRTLAYVLEPEDGNPTLVVRDLASATERREVRASGPFFAGAGRFVVFTHTAPIAEIDAAKRAHKTEDEMPKGGVGILDLQLPGAAQVTDGIKSFAVAREGGATIAYLAVPSPAPSPAAGAASPGPAAKAKEKERGAALTIRDLASGTSVVAAGATEYVISGDDRFVAYVTESEDGAADGVHVYDTVSHATFDVAAGAGRYRKLALSRDGSTLAFLSDAATYAQAAPRDALYVADLRAPKPAARMAVGEGTAGLAPGTAPSANGDVAFSRDGARIFFGTAAVPAPVPSAAPQPMKVDLWSWNDDVLQSQQKHDADRERKRTYLAVYDVAAARFVQLGTPQMRDVAFNANAGYALGRDDRAYRRATSWTGQEYADLYAISLADGTRRLLAVRARDSSLSPGGRYALAWDESSRHWVAIGTADAHRATLAPNAPVRFDLAGDDHPRPAEPEGSGGWLDGDRGVFIYDRYDVWLADPKTGGAVDFTRGAGRAAKTVYSPVQPDADATAYDASRPVLFSILNERTFASGYARVASGGGDPQTLLELDERVNGTRTEFTGSLHDLGMPPVPAKNADRYAFLRESFRTYDLWTSDTSFAGLQRASDANPQQSGYRWGTERLISYRSADGTPLRAILLVPDGLRPGHRAPMLVYFYEVMTPTFHTYYRPAPGTVPNPSRYVSNGYVMLLPDVHYRVGHPGKSALDSILPAVDAAVRTGYVDASRVGISGHSWAAYQINYMITKTHRFRAAEAGAAVDDMIAAYGGIRLESGAVRESQYEHGQSRIGAAPWERPDLYIENSGIFGIQNVTTPYLTIHNDMDGAVPQFQGIEFVTAMRRLGKIAYLFAFDGEEHGLRGREQQKYWTVHLDEWFDYWLEGAPRPQWMDGIDYLHRGERDVTPLYGQPH